MIAVRAASFADLPATAKLAAKLVRFHHALDPKRFMVPVDQLEVGYERFLATRLDDEDVVLLVADDGGSIVGYAYGALEERDWNSLLDAHGALHDVWVEEGARRAGVGARLVSELCARLTSLGAPRVVLASATQNHAAQKLFASLGFRQTMVEMTRETDTETDT